MRKSRLLYSLLLVIVFGLCSSNAYSWLQLKYKGNGQYWDMNNMSTPMPYWINPNFTDQSAGSSADQIAAIENAANTWNGQGNANFQFEYQGTTNIDTIGKDNVHIIAGRDDCVWSDVFQKCLCSVESNGKISAFSYGTSILNTGEIKERDIIICDGAWEFFASQNPSETPGSTQMDIWGLLVHELGHNLGLHHPYDAYISQNVCSVMQPGWFTESKCGWAWNEVDKRSLTSDDIAGIQAIYGVYDPGLKDDDADGVVNDSDNCPSHSNSNQADLDSDGTGDVCDNDADGDGLVKKEESVLGTSDLDADTDGDGLNDYEEYNFYNTDPLNSDTDGDGVNDYKEIEAGTDPFVKDNPAAIIAIIVGVLLDDDDSDGDGIENNMDNCSSISNPDQTDLDGDGLGDECDSDIDGDEINNENDNCPVVANVDQIDGDGDGIGNVCDPTTISQQQFDAMIKVYKWLKGNDGKWPFTKEQMCKIYYAVNGIWPDWCEDNVR